MADFEVEVVSKVAVRASTFNDVITRAETIVRSGRDSNEESEHNHIVLSECRRITKLHQVRTI